MPTTNPLPVENLALDLKNFRTVEQASESDAVKAMIAIHSDRFWALMESLIDDGFHPTENIIVLKVGEKLIVKEGNRRIAALKLIHGQLSRSDLAVPGQLEERIAATPKTWRSSNTSVPCAVFEEHEAQTVDKIVALTHGKGENAGRDPWNAVAKARHSRTANKTSEPALDLLEKYLQTSTQVTEQQRELWAGDYPLSVLEEALKRIGTKIGTSSRSITDTYPDPPGMRPGLDSLVQDIGLKKVGHPELRDKTKDFSLDYEFAHPAAGPSNAATSGSNTAPSPSTAAAASSSASPGAGTAPPRPTQSRSPSAVSSLDPRSVARTLKKFAPKGSNRSKLMMLVDEARKLRIKTHPNAFCFILRALFEISAKAYCKEHESTVGCPSTTDKNGKDRRLVDILREITKHLTDANGDLAIKKVLHGAMTELGNPYSILSVTSMNQLVHSPNFSVDESHICLVFGNIFPLLEAMNQ